jgi:hypothetical protein
MDSNHSNGSPEGFALAHALNNALHMLAISWLATLSMLDPCMGVLSLMEAFDQ